MVVIARRPALSLAFGTSSRDNFTSFPCVDGLHKRKAISGRLTSGPATYILRTDVETRQLTKAVSVFSGDLDSTFAITSICVTISACPSQPRSLHREVA